MYLPRFGIEIAGDFKNLESPLSFESKSDKFKQYSVVNGQPV